MNACMYVCMHARCMSVCVWICGCVYQEYRLNISLSHIVSNHRASKLLLFYLYACATCYQYFQCLHPYISISISVLKHYSYSKLPYFLSLLHFYCTCPIDVSHKHILSKYKYEVNSRLNECFHVLRSKTRDAILFLIVLSLQSWITNSTLGKPAFDK